MDSVSLIHGSSTHHHKQHHYLHHSPNSSSGTGGGGGSHHQSSTTNSVAGNLLHLQLNQQIGALSHGNLVGSGGGGGGGGGSTTTSGLKSSSGIGPHSPPLSVAAYSHLHNVMGGVPVYDISDYQHL